MTRTLRDAGYLVAPVPAQLGGLGVSSVHDLVVASGRLARGDASVAIGVNMHLVAVAALARRLQVAVAAGELEVVVGNLYPLSEARRAHEDMRERKTTGKQLLDPSL